VHPPFFFCNGSRVELEHELYYFTTSFYYSYHPPSLPSIDAKGISRGFAETVEKGEEVC